MGSLPSGNLLQFAIENGPFSSLIYPLKMVMFHSYLELPEGRRCVKMFESQFKALLFLGVGLQVY